MNDAVAGIIRVKMRIYTIETKPSPKNTEFDHRICKEAAIVTTTATATPSRSGDLSRMPKEVLDGTVWFTNAGPHPKSISCAAWLYTALTGCVLFAAAASKMPIVCCRQLEHVSMLPLGSCMPRGR